ncbi:hypothetical protein M9458_037503, partial [Cirrhinus mrigala]
VPTTPFRDQVVHLQALPSEEADLALALIVYVDRSRTFRHSKQLFVCFGGQQKGNAVSKQRLAHWVVDAITLAYESHGESCPLGVRAHSTRSVASSYALAHGASLTDMTAGDGHDRCLMCLGIKHSETAFEDESCAHCGSMTVADLRIRLCFLQRGGVPVPLPRSSVPSGKCWEGTTSGGS